MNDDKTPLQLLAKIELADRVDVELVRLELQRLASRYGATLKTVSLERQVD